MITSPHNPKVKLIRALQGRAKERREAGIFVIDGVRLVEEAVNSNWEIQSVLYDQSISARGMLQVESLMIRGLDVEEVSTIIMKTISETENPQGILAIVTHSPLPIPASPSFILIPDQIRDPGNLGTLIRSAAATNVDAVLLPPETTDAFAPKVLRAGMGAHFKLPILSMTWDEINQVTKSAGLKVFVADMGAQSCWEADLSQPLALIMGSEADGASKEARKLATQQISIPMSASVESLNAGAAGSVLMFEVVRQRKSKA